MDLVNFRFWNSLSVSENTFFFKPENFLSSTSRGISYLPSSQTSWKTQEPSGEQLFLIHRLSVSCPCKLISSYSSGSRLRKSPSCLLSSLSLNIKTKKQELCASAMLIFHRVFSGVGSSLTGQSEEGLTCLRAPQSPLITSCIPLCTRHSQANSPVVLGCDYISISWELVRISGPSQALK